jgi:putative flippase GtrA
MSFANTIRTLDLQGGGGGGGLAPIAHILLSDRKEPAPIMWVRVREWIRGLVPYALKFGAVGVVCYGIDVVIFNLLRTGLFGEHFFSGPIGAKIISSILSTVAAWVANRLWTFRRRRRHDIGVEFAEFLVVAAIGGGIGVACLWVSHYLLGFDDLLADNISGNVIGLILATAFRFLAYRYWVFGSTRAGSRARSVTTGISLDEVPSSGKTEG